MALKLVADPTFDSVVEIPRLGGDEKVAVRFTFKHRKVAEFEAWLNSLDSEEARARSDAEAVLDVATAWELSEEFTPENVGVLCQNYPGIAVLVVRHYMTAYAKARLGN